MPKYTLPKFYKGEVVKVLTGKYKGRKVEIKEHHPLHAPNLYTVWDFYNNIEFAMYEDELERSPFCLEKS